MKKKKKKKVLVLLDYPPPFGGVRVSAVQLFNFLKLQTDVQYVSSRFESDTRNIFISFIDYVIKMTNVDIVVFLVGDVFTLLDKRGSIFLRVAKLLSKKIVFKGFAGGLEENVNQLPELQKTKLRSLLMASDLITFQTKKDFNFFSGFLFAKKNIQWFPNTRENSEHVPITITDRICFSKACFVGKVWKEKGIDTILDCAKLLHPSISIDIYGPLDTSLAEDEIFIKVTSGRNISYKGLIDSKDVARLIAGYDALLLPTRWKKEGYPGVILEAFSVGVPVIATNWNGIPELVDTESGILIEPFSPEELSSAIEKLYNDPLKWKKLSEGAIQKSLFFNSTKWNKQFHSWITKL